MKPTNIGCFSYCFYLKNYPTYDVLGHLFGFSGGHACGHVQNLTPVLRRALADSDQLPLRVLDAPPDLHKALGMQEANNKGNMIIDATERTCVRPQNKELQKARYSGKKTPYDQKSNNHEFCKENMLSGAYTV